MALTKQAFTPSNGFKDTSSYPNPATGAINRAQRMLPHEQMQTYVNTVLTAELDAALGLKADDTAVVKLTGNQTVAGVKTFSSSPIVPNGTTAQTATTQGQLDTHKTSSDHDTRYYTETELNAGQLDTRYYTETEVDGFAVKLTGNQTVAGIKTFSSSPVVPTPTTDTQASTKKYVDDENAKDVHLASDQTITGIKTFSSSPIVPDATTATQSASKGQVDAVNSALVTHKTSADHDGRYYTETEIDSKLQGIIVGQTPDRSIVGTKLALKAVSLLEVADNTITEAQMANDMKKQAGGVLPFDIYTAADVLAKIKTVDGTGSGLDADLLDGISSTSFMQVGITGNNDLNTAVQSGCYRVYAPANCPSGCEEGQVLVIRGNTDTITQIITDYSSAKIYWRSGNPIQAGGGGTWGAWRELFHTGNYGAVRNFTGSLTLSLDVANTVDVFWDGGGNSVVTVPANASVPHPIGTQIVLCRGGDSEVTVTPEAGVNIYSEGSKRSINARFQTMVLIKQDVNVWMLSGALK